MANVTELVGFVINLVIRLTAQLVVELLKLGILSLVIIGSLSILVFVMIFGLRWTYVTYNGDIFAMVCAAIFLMALEFVTLLAIQYTVRDVLHLTDMSLKSLAGVVISAIRKQFKRSETRKDEPLSKNVPLEKKLAEHQD